MKALARVPVFRKDLRVLLRPLLWFTVLQAVYVVAASLITGWSDRFAVISEVVIVLGWSFGQLYAFIAAAQLRAEERASGTETFLRRLPASRTRITAEKLAAGLTALAFLCLLQAAVQTLATPLGGLWDTVPVRGGVVEGMSLWDSLGILLIITATSYGVGLPVSLVSRRPIVAVLAAFAVWWAGFGFSVLATSQFVSWGILWVNAVIYAPLLAVPLALALQGRPLRVLRWAGWGSAGRGLPGGLLGKSLVESGSLQVLALIALPVAALMPLEVDSLVVYAGALILVTALGTSSYAPAEKRGLGSVLYHHPMPRPHLFWAKASAAVLPVIAISLGVYVHGLRAGVLPLSTVLAAGAYAYTCSLLVTLAIQRPSTALLTAQCVVSLSFATPLILADLFQPARGLPRDELTMALLRASSLPFALLAAGCLAGAWWIATSRRALTESDDFRVARAGALLVVLLAVALALGFVGWGGGGAAA